MALPDAGDQTENGQVSASAAADGAAAMGADDEASLCGALFRGRVFFLGREVPREALLLVIRCVHKAPGLASRRLADFTTGRAGLLSQLDGCTAKLIRWILQSVSGYAIGAEMRY